MADLETRTPEQLARAAAVSPAALVTVQEPGGPVTSVEVQELFRRIASVGIATETLALLAANLAHVANTQALVFADPDPLKNGWYRKLGASGAGSWELFDQLSKAARLAAQSWAEGAGTPGDAGSKSAKTWATEAGLSAGLADASASRVGQQVAPPGRLDVGGSDGLAIRLDQYRWRGAPFERVERAALKAGRVAARDTADRVRTFTPLGATIAAVNDGQSLKNATSGGRLANRTVGGPANWLMLDTGIKRVARGAAPTRRQAGERNGDTGWCGAMQMIEQLLLEENGVVMGDDGMDYLALSAAVSGTGLAALNTSAYHYDSELDAALLAANPLKPLCLGWVHDSHGQADYGSNTSEQAYIDLKVARIDKIRQSALTKTGFATPAPYFMSQLSTHLGNGRADPTIARAIQRLARERPRPGIFVATPEYIFTYYDANHLYMGEYTHAGAYLGWATKRVVFDGLDWRPVDPLIEIDGKHIVMHGVDLAPGARFVFDHQRVPQQPNEGLQVVTAGGAPIAIDKVHLAGAGKAIVVTTGSARSATDKLQYGYTTNQPVAGWAGGSGAPATGNGGLGNIREQMDPDLAVFFEPKRRNIALHRWLLIGDYKEAP